MVLKQKPYRFMAEAVVELNRIVDHYLDEEVPEVAVRFREQVQQTAEGLSARYPQIRVFGRNVVVRRALIKGFPHMLVFLERVNENIIIAIAHGKRRPLYWGKRIAKALK